MNDFHNSGHNPDILTCLSNLSNDEVFTPPKVANLMLDMLPKELWHDSSATFLDPACKSGVFLREIAKRLIKGLEDEFPDLQERLDHIFHKQLYGIAITELTSLISRRSLYCSKNPNSEYSISLFDNACGNIRYKQIQHSWHNGKCKFCGASQSEYERGDNLETHAYEWIHTNQPDEIFNMKFDVIVSNPPYQLNDGGGNGKSARPIYQKFVEQAKALKPQYITMIIPSRWFTGGKGLDKFRQDMLSDKHIVSLVDYDNFKDVFPSVDLAGGVCYFLWDNNSLGFCDVTNVSGGKKTTTIRALNEYEIFIRQNQAVGIVDRVRSLNYHRYLNDTVYSRMPFGINSNYMPKKSGIPCHFTQSEGLQYVDPSDLRDTFNLLDKWKFLVPKAPIAGQTDFSKPIRFYYDGNTRIAKPGECCSETWLVAGAFDSEVETRSYKSYIFTKTVRFLLLQTVISQNMSKKNFCFIPAFERYDEEYTDSQLRELWGITDEEWEYIDSKISAIDGDNNAN